MAIPAESPNMNVPAMTTHSALLTLTRSELAASSALSSWSECSIYIYQRRALAQYPGESFTFRSFACLAL